MLVICRAPVFGGAAMLQQASQCDTSDLQGCVDDANSCTNPTGALTALQSCQPDVAIIDLLGKALDVGPGFSNAALGPFVSNPLLLQTLRVHAPSNPNSAILVANKAIDSVVGAIDKNLRSPLTDNQTVDEATRVLAFSIPKATADFAARGILKLKELSDLTSESSFVKSAAVALASLPKPPSPSTKPGTPSVSPRPGSTALDLSPRAKTALLIVTGVAAVGGGAFLLWRVGRPIRHAAPAMAARRRRRR